MPTNRGKKALIVARKDLLGWPEAKALINTIIKEITTFLQEEVVCRHSVFKRLVINRGPENQGVIITFIKKYSIKRV